MKATFFAESRNSRERNAPRGKPDRHSGAISRGSAIALLTRMSDSTPLRRRASDVDASLLRLRSEAGRDVGDSRSALHGVVEDARRAGELVADLEREFDGLRRLADAKVVVQIDDRVAVRQINRRWAALALGAVVLFSTWGLGATNRATAPDTPASIEGAEFSGTIKPSQTSTLTADAGGTVQRILVAVGDNVAAGQPLVEIDDVAARAALESARLEYQSAASEAAHWERSIATLDRSIQEVSSQFAESNGALALAQRQAEQVPGRQFRDSPERAQAAFDYESNRLQRLRKLHGQLLVSDEQLEEQMTVVRIAQNDLDNAKQWRDASLALQRAQQTQAQQQVARTRADFTQVRADYVARLAQANGRADQARQHVAAAERTLGNSVVRAATAGVVVDIPVDVGGRAIIGAPVISIARLDELLVEVPVSSKLVNVLQVGEQAMVTLPTLPPQEVHGRIGSINPIPAANMTHMVEVEFSNSSGQLLSGQRAQVVFR
jgi:multidrug efflux pump subunit AcrA (membrane-fusion protein)